MPTDWLEKLSASLQPDKPSSEWKTVTAISSKLRCPDSTVRSMAQQKIASGEWEAKQFRVRHNGKLVLLWHYRPSNARSVMR